ncbi:MAG: hypothetical protein RIS35_2487, partial [Pseudomonadota bacterium]
MSLEVTLQETNELLRAVLATLQSGLQAQSALGESEAPAKRSPGRPRKADAQAAATVVVAQPSPTPAEVEAARAKHAAGQPLSAGEAAAALFGHA